MLLIFKNKINHIDLIRGLNGQLVIHWVRHQALNWILDYWIYLVWNLFMNCALYLIICLIN